MAPKQKDPNRQLSSNSSGTSSPWTDVATPSISSAKVENPIDLPSTINEQNGFRRGEMAEECSPSLKHHKRSTTTSDDSVPPNNIKPEDSDQGNPNTLAEVHSPIAGGNKTADAVSFSLPVMANSLHDQKPNLCNERKDKRQSTTNDSLEDHRIASNAFGDSESSDAEAHEKETIRQKSKKLKKSTARAKVKPVKPETTEFDFGQEPYTDEEKKTKKGRVRRSKNPKVKARPEEKRAKRRGPSNGKDESSQLRAKSLDSKIPSPEASKLEPLIDDVISRAIAHLTALRLRGLAIDQNATSTDEEEEGEEDDNEEECKPKGDVKRGSKLEFIRIDRLWSEHESRFILSPSTVDQKAGQYEEYAFNIIRHFNFKKQHTSTELKILSKPLKTALIHVMRQVKGISLEEDKPCIDPNIVFLHLEELHEHMKQLKSRSNSESDKRKARQLTIIAKHLKLLVEYIEKDYDDIKRSLYPMLDSGKITFDLAWALFKSNEILYTDTYNSPEQPRAVRVEYVTKNKSVLDGDYYRIDGRYLDTDGKVFGMAEVSIDVMEFKGSRKISRLACYPLKYHENYAKLRSELIERGKKFVALEGMQYRFQRGIAFHKKDKKFIKVHINGRVMLDPVTFRRLRPNYPFSQPKKEHDVVTDSEESDKDIDNINEATTTSSSDEAAENDTGKEKKKTRRKQKMKVYCDSDDSGQMHATPVNNDDIANETVLEPMVPESKDTTTMPTFTEEEYLIASPVVLGFSFTEKLWLEFAVSGIQDIHWDEGAFDSLIIPDDQKRVIRALIETHAQEDKKNIDDVIQGKGRGLVGVLHGAPGTGKTLTAEGIAELLKKPLYTVSVGELGVKGGDVERNLTQILDIANTWGALLLIDEADVFLEARTAYDVGRNALVSIFLRMLEYFQGILFLTTNRVSVFDPAFASRIHIGLRYDQLTPKAKKSIWKLFINKVKALPDTQVEELTEEEYSRLANFEMNGREIKNSVRTAQSIALIEKEPLGMKHLIQVLLVGSAFAKDLKGAGYEEALKFYM